MDHAVEFAMAGTFLLVLLAPGVPDGLITWVLVIAILALAVVGVWRLIRSGDRHRYFLRRLWPDIAAAGEQAELDVRATS